MLKLFFLFFLILTMQSSATKVNAQITISWRKAAEIRNTDGSISPGFAGPVNGISKSVFITAGGANFPGALPWNGGQKVYYNSIYAFDISDESWNSIAVGDTLPEPIAYAGTASVPTGIVYVGGENANGISKKAYLLTWDEQNQKTCVLSLPDLPAALTNIAVAGIGNTIYAAGGDGPTGTSTSFFALNLDADSTVMAWDKLPDLPLPLANEALISLKNKLYLIGGRSKTASGISELHNTVFCFDTNSHTWQQRGRIMNGAETTNLSAAAVTKVNGHSILAVGGDDGRVFHEIETLISKITKADDDVEKESLIAKKTALQSDHQGFNRSLLLYDADMDKWTNIGIYPFDAQVTTSAILYDNKIIISNGEVKPGIRTPAIIVGTIKNRK